MMTKKSILLIDDDQRLREQLKDYLNEKNFQVFTSVDFDEAKEILGFFIFDLIILDRMMPTGDGINLIQDIKKTSTIVMKYMQDYGFKVYPVNPSAKGEKILGEEVYAKVTDINKNVEIVDVFRPSSEAYGIAEDAVKIGAKVLWLQLGIRDQKAKKLVEENKMEYVENKCTKMEYQKYFLKVRQAFPVLSD